MINLSERKEQERSDDMEKFIEELKTRGIMDRMVKSCIVANTVTGRNKIPAEAVEMMLTSEMKKDDTLTEMFVDAVSDWGFLYITNKIQEEVDKMGENKTESKVTLKDKAEVLNFLNNVLQTIINLDDDLK